MPLAGRECRMSELWIKIRRRKDRKGKWLVDVKRGAERSVRTFSTYEEADEAARAVRRAQRRGELRVEKPKPRTLAELCTSFLTSKRNEGLAPDSLTIYRVLLERVVIPRIGAAREPKDVTEADIERYRDNRLKEVSRTTVNREMDRLRALLSFAQKQGIISRNPAESVKPPKLCTEPKGWLLSNEIAPFLDACSQDFATIAKFAIFTGLRRREVIFLQRGDVDLRNNVIQVRAKPHLGFRPKSGQERSVPIDPALRPLLENWLTSHVRQGLEAWIFPTRDGTRRDPHTRWFAVSVQRAAHRVGISRPLSFHCLRRTYGAMLIEAGVDIYTVSRLLGHADVRITQKVYAPISGKFLAQEASKLGRYLGPALIREASLPPIQRLGPK